MQTSSSSIIGNAMKDQYLTFTIENEDCGIEIAYVNQIIKMVPITRVPHMPNFIEGLINLRGELIGVISVRKRFGMPQIEYDDSTCIIVITIEDYNLGMIVDAVQETVIIEGENITEPPTAKLNNINQFIRNIGKVDGKIKLLIDIEKFLAQD